MPEASVMEAYASLGALGVSFLVLIGIIIAYIKNINPSFKNMTTALHDLQQMNATHSSVLENNTTALETVARSVQEVAKSNENVASMVNLLTTTLDAQARSIERHDLDSSLKFNEAITHLKDNHQDLLRAVEKNGECNDKQHKEISDQLIRHDDRSQRIETEVGRVKGHVNEVKIIATTKGV